MKTTVTSTGKGGVRALKKEQRVRECICLVSLWKLPGVKEFAGSIEAMRLFVVC